ncbi:MAG: CaiB/BaiF CoA-transferase family protein [Halobacteriota archaeon]|nr:CaiB/BaiF CoA-transferase family protein [Halobacteriota archaeon]
MLLLEGVKILDLSRMLPGPYCTMLLSDLGAEVLVVEIPGRAFTPPHLQRNKKSINLNLKTEVGRDIFYRIVKDFDVVIEGFRPGITKSLGIDYDAVKKVNPDVIYCSISGFGQDGPYKNIAGHDINYVGYGGILSVPGRPPEIPGTTIADLGSSMFAVISILAALLGRKETSEGQYIDISMLDSMVSWMSTSIGRALAGGSVSTYGIFEVKDGYITLGALEDKFRKSFFKIMKDLADPESRKHVKKKEVFSDILKRKTVSEWVKLLTDADVPCSPVNTPDEVLEDPQVLHRGMVVEIDGPTGKMRLAPFPGKFSDSPVQTIRSPPPAVGEDTREVLLEFGYSEEDIEKFKVDKVI